MRRRGPGNFEADVLEVGGGGEATLAELVDVEGELGLDVGVRVFSVVDVGAIFLLEFGKFDRDGEIDGVAVADGVADVVRERADGEGELVGGVGVAEEADDEVSGANVVGEVGEEAVAEGVVAEVLDGAAAVGVGVSLLELGFGEGGVMFEKNGPDGLLPGDVDQLLVGLDGVGNGGHRREEQSEQGYRFKEGGAAVGGNRLASFLVCFDSTHCTRMKKIKKGRLAGECCDAGFRERWVRYAVAAVAFGVVACAWHYGTRQSGGIRPVGERQGDAGAGDGAA